MTKPHNRKPAHDMALAIVGSVCGAVIPFAFDGGAEVKLVGAAIEPATTPGTSLPTAAPKAALTVSPTTMVCKPLCASKVTLTNRGSASLRIGAIEFEGAGRRNFRSEGECAHQALAAGRQCALTIRFVPVGATEVSANLVVHPELSEPVTVQVVGQPGCG